MLEDDAKDTMASISLNIKILKWLERYNCNGVCRSYLESCNGSCNHQSWRISKGGITLNFTRPVYLEKCGNKCFPPDKMDELGLHDCGDKCLSQSLPCNGICPNTTRTFDPQLKCGNECRPDVQYMDGINKWGECPDGSCRDESVECDGPLPGSCPEDQILCKYYSQS